MATVTIEYFGMSGSGRNVTEAKKEAGHKLQEAMSGSYSPRLIESRGTAIIVWRDPHGWRSNFVSRAGTFYPPETAFQCYSSGYSLEEAYASALLSVAQDTWDGKEMIPPVLGEMKIKNKDEKRDLLREFASWRGFQLAYKHARAVGIVEQECHHWACTHANEFVGEAV